MVGIWNVSLQHGGVEAILHSMLLRWWSQMVNLIRNLKLSVAKLPPLYPIITSRAAFLWQCLLLRYELFLRILFDFPLKKNTHMHKENESIVCSLILTLIVQWSTLGKTAADVTLLLTMANPVNGISGHSGHLLNSKFRTEDKTRGFLLHRMKLLQLQQKKPKPFKIPKASQLETCGKK